MKALSPIIQTLEMLTKIPHSRAIISSAVRSAPIFPFAETKQPKKKRIEEPQHQAKTAVDSERRFDASEVHILDLRGLMV